MSQSDSSGPINLKQLSYFLSLVEHGSISVAAKALNMAQPSLSENIAKLEKQLDVKLAVRGTRGIQVTEAGLILANRGREIMRSIDAMIEEVRLSSGESRGPVSVGFTPSLSLLLSVPLLETIHSEYPLVRLHIAEAMSGNILEWIDRGRIDIGFVYEVSDSAQYTFEPILDEELFLVTAVDNWAGEIGPDGVALEPLDPARLSKLPLVLTSPAHGARKLQEKFARTIGISLNAVAEVDSLPHIIEMASRASAYTLLSHGAVYRQVASGALALVPIKEPTVRRTAYLVRARNRPITRAGLLVGSSVKQIISELVSRHHLRATVAPGDEITSRPGH